MAETSGSRVLPEGHLMEDRVRHILWVYIARYRYRTRLFVLGQEEPLDCQQGYLIVDILVGPHHWRLKP